MNKVEIPNGLIAVISADLARYTSFHSSLMDLRRSLGSPVRYFTGVNIAASCNTAIQFMVNNKFEWIWFLGDDHTFDRDILFNMLTKMYDQNLDILVPLCPFRKPPFGPVMFGPECEGRPGFWKTIHWWDIDKSQGNFEVYAAGSAGMLIRKNVFEVMEQPYFRVGQDRPDSMAEDLNFCKRAKSHGFKVLIDLDSKLGHTTNCTVYPHKDKDGNWGFLLDFGFETKFALVPIKDNKGTVYNSADDSIID
jgi:hypothetical protein